MSNLTGLELRKKACEALGYTSQPAYGKHDYEWWNSNEQIEANFVCHGVENLPAIESDPAVAWPIFLEWCMTNGYAFDLHWDFKLDWQFELTLYPCGGPTNTLIVRGSSPEECIALVIVKASEPK